MLPLRGRFPEGVAVYFSVTFSARDYTTLASVAVVPKSWDCSPSVTTPVPRTQTALHGW